MCVCVCVCVCVGAADSREASTVITPFFSLHQDLALSPFLSLLPPDLCIFRKPLIPFALLESKAGGHMSHTCIFVCV